MCPHRLSLTHTASTIQYKVGMKNVFHVVSQEQM